MHRIIVRGQHPGVVLVSVFVPKYMRFAGMFFSVISLLWLGIFPFLVSWKLFWALVCVVGYFPNVW